MLVSFTFSVHISMVMLGIFSHCKQFTHDKFFCLAEPTIKKQIESNEKRLKEANLVYAQVGNREE